MTSAARRRASTDAPSSEVATTSTSELLAQLQFERERIAEHTAQLHAAIESGDVEALPGVMADVLDAVTESIPAEKNLDLASTIALARGWLRSSFHNIIETRIAIAEAAQALQRYRPQPAYLAGELQRAYVALAGELQRAYVALGAQGDPQMVRALVNLRHAPAHQLPDVVRDIHTALAGVSGDIAAVHSGEAQQVLRARGLADLFARLAPTNGDDGFMRDDAGRLILRSADPQEIDMHARYVAPGFPAGEVGLLLGARGIGKTHFLLDLSLRVCTDEEAGRPVLYIATEGMRGIFARVAGWCAHHGVIEPAMTREGLHCTLRGDFHLAARPLRLNHPQLGEILRDTIRSMDAALVVIDTVNKSLGGELSENSNDDVGSIMSTLEQVGADTDACILLAHHFGHGDKSRARGASAWEDGAGFVYRIEGSPAAFSAGAPALLQNTKMKNDEQPTQRAFQLRKVPIQLDGVKLGTAIIEEVSVAEAMSAQEEFSTVAPLSVRVFRAIHDAGRAGLTNAALRRAVAGKGVLIDVEVDALITLGAIRDVGTDRAHKYVAVDGFRVRDNAVVETDGLDLGSAVEGEGAV
jgi:archaellum biogenesis ATPase FlaH